MQPKSQTACFLISTPDKRFRIRAIIPGEFDREYLEPGGPWTHTVVENAPTRLPFVVKDKTMLAEMMSAPEIAQNLLAYVI
jgi:hypothetical protein